MVQLFFIVVFIAALLPGALIGFLCRRYLGAEVGLLALIAAAFLASLATYQVGAYQSTGALTFSNDQSSREIVGMFFLPYLAAAFVGWVFTRARKRQDGQASK